VRIEKVDKTTLRLFPATHVLSAAWSAKFFLRKDYVNPIGGQSAWNLWNLFRRSLTGNCRPYPGGPPCPPVVLKRRFQASSSYQPSHHPPHRLCQQ